MFTLGALVYLAPHEKSIAEHRVHALGTQPQLDRQTRVADGSAVEIGNAKHLIDVGAIDEARFAQIKCEALA